MRLAGLVAASLVAACPALAQDFPGFARQAAGGGHAVMEVAQPHPVRLPGVVTTRFELRPGECGAPCPPDTERAELAEQGPGLAPGTEAFTALSLFIPRGTTATPGLVVTLARLVQGEQVLLALEWRETGLLASGPAVGGETMLVPASALTQRWHDVLIDQRWSAGVDGRLVLWVNGQRLVQRSGANAVAGVAVRLVHGLSRAPVSAWTARFGVRTPTQVVYFAHVRRDADRGAVDIDLRVR
ncbi:hypothetical protein [Phreatobacter cathodiphilus]|uniref:Uncharacterized protein n=1 Tax=Phreatobacter cathodiphilus TaxID=1868589 RepID=A0A2S0NDG2_9HYPH|nr:hypothetical protein [Phreatobacter cathodiphilus]AVO46202.1 hypothetical protein C6569_14665 [Phreatobacter cathodiphilus]